MAKKPKQSTSKTVEATKHPDATRKNIPTAEFQSVLQKREQDPVRVTYARNRDLDPQLVCYLLAVYFWLLPRLVATG